MSNVLIGVSNMIDDSSLPAYGSWVSTLPISNIRKRQQGLVARSTDDATASTKFRITLVSPYLVRVIGIFNHNLSTAATIRFINYSDAGFTTIVYDSGALSAFPNVFEPGYATGWADPTPGTPRPYTTKEAAFSKKDYIHVLPTGRENLYWQIEFNDTSNPDNYVQFGRVFIGPAWQPAYNFNFGQNIGFEDTSDIKYALDGTAYFNERPLLRVANFTLAALNELEAMQSAYEIDRMCGQTKEVVYIYDPADTYNILRRRFMGIMRKLSPIEQPEAYNNFSKSYEIKEVM
jgi:hypothetical protein